MSVVYLHMPYHARNSSLSNWPRCESGGEMDYIFMQLLEANEIDFCIYFDRRSLKS